VEVENAKIKCEPETIYYSLCMVINLKQQKDNRGKDLATKNAEFEAFEIGSAYVFKIC